MRNNVEGEGVGEKLVLDRLAFDKAGNARLELVHAWGRKEGREGEREGKGRKEGACA